jgi:hypothetical protein
METSECIIGHSQRAPRSVCLCVSSPGKVSNDLRMIKAGSRRNYDSVQNLGYE